MPTFTDDFNRANGALGNNWVTTRNTVLINNGRLIGSQAMTINTTYTSAGSISATTTADTYGWSELWGGPVVKCNEVGAGGYVLETELNFQTLHARIVRLDSPIQAVLADITWPAAEVYPWVMTLEWNNGHLTGTVNGVHIAQADDSNYAAYLYAGVRVHSANGATTSYSATYAGPVRTLAVTPDPLWVGGGPQQMLATGTGTTWTAGVPGSSTITVDHGAISDQWTADATHIHFTYTPGEYIGTLTFTESQYSLTDTVNAVVNQPEGWSGSEGCPFDADFIATANATGHVTHSALPQIDTSITIADPSGPVPFLTLLSDLWMGIFRGYDRTGGSNNLYELLRSVYGAEWGGEEWLGASLAAPGTNSIATRLAALKAVVDGFPTGLYPDFASIVDGLAGDPFASHRTIVDAIEAIPSTDLSTVMSRLDQIQGDGVTSLATLLASLAGIRTNQTYSLGDVKAWIDALPRDWATHADTLLIEGSIGAIALEIAALSAAEAEDAAASTEAAAASTAAGALLAVELPLILDTLQRIKDLLTPSVAARPVPPIWPGEANVTWGMAVPIESNEPVAERMHGVVVHITGCEAGTRRFGYDGIMSWSHVGGLAFGNDMGDLEPFQVLGSEHAVYCPKAMTEAFTCRLYRSRNVKGTIRPWTMTGL